MSVLTTEQTRERHAERARVYQERKRLRARGEHEEADRRMREEACWKLCQVAEDEEERKLLLSYVIWPTELMDSYFATLHEDAAA